MIGSWIANEIPPFNTIKLMINRIFPTFLLFPILLLFSTSNIAQSCASLITIAKQHFKTANEELNHNKLRVLHSKVAKQHYKKGLALLDEIIQNDCHNSPICLAGADAANRLAKYDRAIWLTHQGLDKGYPGWRQLAKQPDFPSYIAPLLERLVWIDNAKQRPAYLKTYRKVGIRYACGSEYPPTVYKRMLHNAHFLHKNYGVAYALWFLVGKGIAVNGTSEESEAMWKQIQAYFVKLLRQVKTAKEIKLAYQEAELTPLKDFYYSYQLPEYGYGIFAYKQLWGLQLYYVKEDYMQPNAQMQFDKEEAERAFTESEFIQALIKE